MKPKDKVRKPKEKVVAVLTIHDAAGMTPDGAIAVQNWLVDEAKALLFRRQQYSPLYRARYVAQKGRKK